MNRETKIAMLAVLMSPKEVLVVVIVTAIVVFVTTRGSKLARRRRRPTKTLGTLETLEKLRYPPRPANSNRQNLRPYSCWLSVASTGFAGVFPPAAAC